MKFALWRECVCVCVERGGSGEVDPSWAEGMKQEDGAVCQSVSSSLRLGAIHRLKANRGPLAQLFLF